MRSLVWMLGGVLLLSGCVWPDDPLYNDPRDNLYDVSRGYMDTNPGGSYREYQTIFLHKYYLSFRWLQSSDCNFRQYKTGVIPEPQVREMMGSELYHPGLTIWKVNMPEFYEQDGKIWQAAMPEVYELGERIWQASIFASKPLDKTNLFSSVRYTSRAKGTEGEESDIGFDVLCGETWWRTSHYLDIRLHKLDVATWRRMAETGRSLNGTLPMQVRFPYSPKGRWFEHKVGKNTWTAFEVDEQDLLPPPLNGVGETYKAWLLPLADRDTLNNLAFH